MIKDVVDGTHSGINYNMFGAPTGDPMIRLGLDSSFGIVFNRSTLETDGKGLIEAWLRDIHEFTSGDRRSYYWDERLKAYRRIHEGDPVPPSNAVDMLINKLENNLEPIGP
jgi:hypothetical protein